ncbi:transmembrane efflux protein [Streptomyces sp. SPB074]|nr:transmembrane efflux protein [Streptomyces sp. SPB074]
MRPRRATCPRRPTRPFSPATSRPSRTASRCRRRAASRARNCASWPTPRSAPGRLSERTGATPPGLRPAPTTPGCPRSPGGCLPTAGFARLDAAGRTRLSGSGARVRDRPGRSFGWLWGAYAVSAYGTGFGAFPVLAVLVLDAGPARVALLAAAGRAVGALLAVPLGPWVEFRRKRPVMVAADLLRCGALLSVPLAYGFGVLSFGQLPLVSVVTAAADIAFRAASGAHLKWLVPPDGLLLANSRFEATTWSATVLGPPLGGAAIGVLGPVTTVLADALSYLLSALGLRASGDEEPEPVRGKGALSGTELLASWRHLLSEPELRSLFLNTLAVNGLIMATEPLLAVLLLGRLGYAPWEYGLAFAVPCLGGLLGARAARPLARRYGPAGCCG